MCVRKMGDKKKILKCDVCDSKNVYSLQNLTLICRKCGHRKKKEESKS